MRGNSAPPSIRSLAPPAPLIGQFLAGKYRVRSVIGEGGMGTVLAAHHELLDVWVAVKLLSPELVKHRSVVDRFLREARAAARLKSEHVARVTDVGTLECGAPYIVMDLLEGEDLEHRLQRTHRIPIHEAADCVLQALEGMAHAHAAGIIHCDLKPANLFATSSPDGREIIKVLDFGIAKLTDAPSRGTDTRSGAPTEDHAAMGSPSYMAPEQVRGSRTVDQRVDIWALGAILHELLTGQTAFGGESVGEIFGAVLHERPIPLRQLCPEAPAELEALVTRCLERDPRRRYTDVAEVAQALAPFGSGAWSGHVARIEQTLSRARRGGTAKGGAQKLSVLAGMPFSSTPTPSEPSQPGSAPRAFARNAAAGAETQLADPEGPHVSPSRPRLTASVGTALSLAAVIAAMVAVLAVRPRTAAQIDLSSSVASPAMVAAAAPAAQTSVSADTPAFPSPTTSTSSAPHTAAAAAAARSRAAPPVRVAPAAQKRAPHSLRLPSVLDSPE